MKHLFIVLICLGMSACQSNTQNKTELVSGKDSVSYCIGMSIGHNLKSQAVEADPSLVARGILDILDSNKTLLTDEQAQQVMTEYQQRLIAKRFEKNKTDGEAFLAENKKIEGIVSLPSGLQYKIVKTGNGPKPASTDTVTVHYRGTLIDGTEFDSSVKRGEPATFALNGVIKGWTEGLQLMTKGSKWTFFIPQDLAYGETGMRQVIQPYSALIFDVELISINGK